MSEAPQPGDRVAALLDRLTDMDLSAAEHVHAQLLAATEPAEVASLSRAYNRRSRSVPRLQREALDRLDYEIDLWLDRDDFDFIDERLDDLVVQVCERASLPLPLARQWETLPRPDQTFDPAENPSPLADTG